MHDACGSTTFLQSHRSQPSGMAPILLSLHRGAKSSKLVMHARAFWCSLGANGAGNWATWGRNPGESGILSH
jgi:hypothetical protein